MNKPRLISTYLPDGTLEGVRIIELSDSSIKAFVVPRLKLGDVKARPELKQPALYLLISSGDAQIYIGESESFFDRIKNHDQSKEFWDLAVAIVSSTNGLEKSDVKYLESLAVEMATKTGAVKILNKTMPTKNNIHEFKLHSLSKILEDVALLVESLGYSLFTDKTDQTAEVWHCDTKLTHATAQFRGDKFVMLAGSVIDKSRAPSWAEKFPYALAERQQLIEKHSIDKGNIVELIENIPFKSPNHAASFAAGRSTDAWTAWKNSDGRTMDEVIRKITQ